MRPSYPNMVRQSLAKSRQLSVYARKQNQHTDERPGIPEVLLWCFMSNYKRKKKKQRKSGWSSSSKLHKHKRIDESTVRNLSKRKKTKAIIVLAKSKPGKPTWWNRLGTTDWFVWSRYEKMKDAENALKGMRTKRYPSEFYEFKIDHQDEVITN